jgi:Zn-finger nucleic acid-binding protein
LSKVKFLESDDIHVHLCRNCGGFWLDGGELKLIDNVLAEDGSAQGHGFSDFVNNVHVPYWYKRIKKPSSETDFTVNVPPIKDAVQKESTADICPVCGQNLFVYSIYSMEFEGCPKCKGIWLIKDELRKLKNKVNGGSMRWLNDEIDRHGKDERTCDQPLLREMQDHQNGLRHLRQVLRHCRLVPAMSRSLAR